MFILDLNNPVDIPSDECDLTVNNVTDENIKNLILPANITRLILNGSLKTYIVPPNIDDLEINNAGLEHITLSEDIRWLICCGNELTHIELNKDIVVALLSHNKKLASITAREPLTSIKSLNIQNNNMKTLDIKLPNTMDMFYMSGNPELRIKYMDFLLDEYNNVIDGDFVDVLGDGLLYRGYVRARLGNKTYQGAKYIDIKRLA